MLASKSLRAGTPSKLTYFTSLSNLAVIVGGLYIEGINPLTKLSGLENLRSVGAIYIQSSELTNLDELVNLNK